MKKAPAYFAKIKRAAFLVLAGCALFSFRFCRADNGGVITNPAGNNGSVQIKEKSSFSYDPAFNYSTVTKTLTAPTIEATSSMKVDMSTSPTGQQNYAVFRSTWYKSFFGLTQNDEMYLYGYLPPAGTYNNRLMIYASTAPFDQNIKIVSDGSGGNTVQRKPGDAWVELFTGSDPSVILHAGVATLSVNGTSSSMLNGAGGLSVLTSISYLKSPDQSKYFSVDNSRLALTGDAISLVGVSGPGWGCEGYLNGGKLTTTNGTLRCDDDVSGSVTAGTTYYECNGAETQFTSSAHYQNFCNFTVPSGTWTISGMLYFENGGGSMFATAGGISLDPVEDSFSDLQGGKNYFEGPPPSAGNYQITAAIPGFIATPTTPTKYYLKGFIRGGAPYMYLRSYMKAEKP